MRSAMKRVRKEETIGNNGQCSKKQDESHKKDPFSILPLDLIVEILFKLPAAKSIARLVFVSKLWSSIIRGKDFTKLYLTRSFTRPRLLFVVFLNYMPTQFLQSFSQEDPSSDPHHRLPEDIQCLVNYNGKIALASHSKLDLVVDENLYFKVRGTLISTGELIFTPTRPVRPFYFISFDLKENNAKKVVVEGIGDNFPSLEFYFDHVESPMVLSNVS
ncbi:unnamed protein product [Arabidopsis arenosa]|uniref:F-box domain-containing protein n=1 Tax=Arabidopsis arenosa TaxID=38785 RepID=A0A8S1ZSM1_ARAAE|nr:unnamed protein product [Arabidopsis arenosa]